MSAVCPYCHSAIAPQTDGADAAAQLCPECGTAHHPECWEENGGCTVYGCQAAPPDEPKLIVSSLEMAPPPPSLVAPPPMPPPLPLFRTQTAPPPPPRPVGPRTMPTQFTFGGYVHTAEPFRPPPPPVLLRAKSRNSYILLGVFLGAFGVHNFYAGYKHRAVAQLAITVCTLFVGSFVSWIWAIVEVCTVERDSRNIYMV